MKDEPLEMGLSIIIIFIAICVLFEVIIVGVAFFGADSVECTFLWCTFTTTKSSSFSERNSECSINGEKVNCTEFENEFPDWAYHGINGVCPGWKENKSMQECINGGIK